jgi:hypothetical protein
VRGCPCPTPSRPACRSNSHRARPVHAPTAPGSARTRPQQASRSPCRHLRIVLRSSAQASRGDETAVPALPTSSSETAKFRCRTRLSLSAGQGVARRQDRLGRDISGLPVRRPLCSPRGNTAEVETDLGEATCGSRRSRRSRGLRMKRSARSYTSVVSQIPWPNLTTDGRSATNLRLAGRSAHPWG